MIKIILFVSLLVNLFLIINFNKKKIKKIFNKKIIKTVAVDEINSIFEPRIISENTKFPSKDHVAKMVLVHDEDYNVKGLVSDYETWILAIMSKISLNIFEFGTCSGKTTYIMALNSPVDAKIETITINEEQASKFNFIKGESKSAFLNLKNESSYKEFMFSGTNIENKIKISFKNSMELDITDLKDKYDLIFIDGGHTYSVIKNDTEKALKMIKKNGYIFWHDYSAHKSSTKDVFKYLNKLNKEIKINHIKDTNMCFYKKQ
tara:strand:+ start:4679 stop:5464 length:786 start_codon:yes stop_codon:yes gene_type:complete